ncbi:hypothetical protein BDD12DRAFT_879740 [Trichophaea hybrida]|nr:hypothetical protein BDD12DRAFT_879740 [Trichophaea hybrida]
MSLYLRRNGDHSSAPTFSQEFQCNLLEMSPNDVIVKSALSPYGKDENGLFVDGEDSIVLLGAKLGTDTTGISILKAGSGRRPVHFKPNAEKNLREYFAMFERVHNLDPLAQVIRTEFSIARLVYSMHQRTIKKDRYENALHMLAGLRMSLQAVFKVFRNDPAEVGVVSIFQGHSSISPINTGKFGSSGQRIQ